MINPYAPPAEPPAPDAPRVTYARPLASRWQRLGGAVVDFIATFVPAAVLARVFNAVTGATASVATITVMMLVPSIVNWYLLATRGQTMGKIVVRTRVVTETGETATFARAVALRAWPVYFLQVAPTLFGPSVKALTSVIAMVDTLFVFGGSRRCLHDRIAGTHVVDDT
jgi:uncharacterized RDD family membrane protein YckC